MIGNYKGNLGGQVVALTNYQRHKRGDYQDFCSRDRHSHKNYQLKLRRKAINIKPKLELFDQITEIFLRQHQNQAEQSPTNPEFICPKRQLNAIKQDANCTKKYDPTDSCDLLCLDENIEDIGKLKKRIPISRHMVRANDDVLPSISQTIEEDKQTEEIWQMSTKRNQKMGFVRETSTAMTSRTKDNNSSLKSYLNTFDIKGTYSKRVDIDVRQLMKTHKRLHQVSKSQTNRPCITDRSQRNKSCQSTRDSSNQCLLKDKKRKKYILVTAK